jgi:hypothetical protein
MKQALLLIIVLCTAHLSFAQQTGPKTKPVKPVINRDSLRIPAPLTIPSGHTLPPSILAELRRSQTKRTLVYHDTLRADDLARMHQNDSTERTYSDSALVILDTAVSLSHQEWIDSELVEIPELVRFGSHVHFNYPPAIMTESQRRAVPFDSTLVEGMNPVTRENLPFFDQSPIPMPLRPALPLEAFIELGAGNVYQPLASAWAAYTISPRASIDGQLNYQALSGQPLHSFFDFNTTFQAALGTDPAEELYHSSDLKANLGYTTKGITISQDSAGVEKNIDHAVSVFNAAASLTGDASDQLHYEASVLDREFNDNLGLSESSQDLRAGFHYDPYISHFRLIGEAEYSRASLVLDTNQNTLSSPATQAIGGEHVSLLFGRRKGEAIEWYAGLTYMGGNGLNASYTSLLPIARVRFPLNPRWELGASFEPQVQLASEAVLAQINPFYSPRGAIADTNIQRAFDNRSVVMDRVNLSAFMNYALSPDDELRLEAHYITRQQEPIFEAHTLVNSQTVFSVTPEDTRRFTLSAAGNFLLFTRDVLTGLVELCSATTTADGQAIPFEPTMKLTAAYHFNSISDIVYPSVEFRSIRRSDQSLNFFDLEARIEALHSLSLLVRAENILGGPSDFWTGYPEYPRSVWATVKYTF